MTKKEMNLFKLKLIFNDAFMRETGLDIDDNDHVYNIDTDSALQIKEKFLKYCDYEYPLLRYNEIDFNLLENPKLCETLGLMWLKDHIENKIISLDQCGIQGSHKGHFVMSYLKDDGRVENISSDAFENESVRVFNLICKILNREHLYDFKAMDVKIEKKSRK